MSKSVRFRKSLAPKVFLGSQFSRSLKKEFRISSLVLFFAKKSLISSLHNGNLVKWILVISSAPFLEGLKTRFFLSHRAPSSVVAMGSWKDDGYCPGELLSLMLYQNSETSSSGKSAVQVEFNCFKNFWCWYSKNIWLKAERMQAYKHRKIRPEMFIWVRLEKNVYTWNTWVQFSLSKLLWPKIKINKVGSKKRGPNALGRPAEAHWRSLHLHLLPKARPSAARLPLLLPLADVLNVWGGSGPIYPKPPGQISQTPIPKFNALIRFDIVDMLQSFNFHQNSNLQFPLVFSILLLLHPDSSPLSHEPLRPCRFCTAYYCRTVVAQQQGNKGFKCFNFLRSLTLSSATGPNADSQTFRTTRSYHLETGWTGMSSMSKVQSAWKIIRVIFMPYSRLVPWIWEENFEVFHLKIWFFNFVASASCGLKARKVTRRAFGANGGGLNGRSALGSFESFAAGSLESLESLVWKNTKKTKTFSVFSEKHSGTPKGSCNSANSENR